MKKAVCLYSGGLDSTTSLFVALNEGYEVIALSFHYGQRHDKEVQFARELTSKLGVKHHEVAFEMPWKGSSLTDSEMNVPEGRPLEEMTVGIPSTYVPARNSIFLALAFSCAEAEGAEVVFIGANAIDYSGYPDCRPEYLKHFEESMRRGTKVGQEGVSIEIKAPLLQLTKKEIVELGARLNVPFEKTWSCYAGSSKPCGKCDSCLLRAKGFEEAGIVDGGLTA